MGIFSKNIRSFLKRWVENRSLLDRKTLLYVRIMNLCRLGGKFETVGEMITRLQSSFLMNWRLTFRKRRAVDTCFPLIIESNPFSWLFCQIFGTYYPTYTYSFSYNTWFAIIWLHNSDLYNNFYYFTIDRLKVSSLKLTQLLSKSLIHKIRLYIMMLAKKGVS